MTAVRENAVALARLALPMIVSRAGLAAFGIADAIMVSRDAPAQLAMLGLADGTLGRIADVFAAFVIGGLILVPRAFGAGDLAACARIWRRSLPPALGLGVLAALLGFACAPLFHALGQPDALASGAGAVAILLGIGKVAALPALGAAVFLEGMKRPAIVAASVVGANALNVALNALLIGGAGPIPALGARGSAISTAIVSAVLALVLATFARRAVAAPSSAQPPAADAPPRAQPAGLQEKLGLSSAIVGGIMLLLTMSLTIFAGRLGSLALAVLAATFTLNAPAMLVILGIADATGIRTASHDGAARGPVGALAATSLAVMLAVALAFAAVWCAAPGALAALFTRDAAMRAELAAVIPLASLLLVADGACFVIVAALRALRDFVWPTVIEITTMAALVPLAAFLAFDASLGVRGLVLAAIATAFVRAALLGARFVAVTSAAPRIVTADA